MVTFRAAISSTGLPSLSYFPDLYEISATAVSPALFR